MQAFSPRWHRHTCLSFPHPNHTSTTSSSHHPYCFGKHQETAGSYRKLAPRSTQASGDSIAGQVSAWRLIRQGGFPRKATIRNSSDLLISSAFRNSPSAPRTTAKLLLTANRNLVCSLFSC